MKLMLKAVFFAVLLIVAIVVIFQWSQPTGIHDSGAGQRVCTAFLGVSWLLFFGVVVAVALMKIK